MHSTYKTNFVASMHWEFCDKSPIAIGKDKTGINNKW